MAKSSPRPYGARAILLDALPRVPSAVADSTLPLRPGEQPCPPRLGARRAGRDARDTSRGRAPDRGRRAQLGRGRRGRGRRRPGGRPRARRQRRGALERRPACVGREAEPERRRAPRRILGDEQARALCERLERMRRPGDLSVVYIHGLELGLRGPRRARPVRARAHRRRGRAGSRSLVAPSAADRALPGKADTLRLRRLRHRLRGDRRTRAVPQTTLVLMYFPRFADGELVELRMPPLRLRRMRLERASRSEGLWLAETLTRESRPYATDVQVAEDGSSIARPAPATCAFTGGDFRTDPSASPRRPGPERRAARARSPRTPRPSNAPTRSAAAP